MPGRPNSTNLPLSDAAALLENSDKIAIASHLRPDGDAIGSLIALGTSLQQKGKTIAFLNGDPVPTSLRFLRGWEKIQTPQSLDFVPECFIALDTSDPSRLGEGATALLEQAPLSLTIDHHQSNQGYGTHCHVDPDSPATGEILYELLQAGSLPLNSSIAEALYVAISTDTGSFRFRSTTSKTLRIAAALVDLGVDPGRISDKLYASYPPRRLDLMRELFSTMRLSAEGRLASWALSSQVAESLEFRPSDAEGLIDILRSVDSVDVAIYFEEQAGGLVKASVRSKSSGPDVAAICQTFGGGGHRNAAGATLKGPLEAAREEFLQTAHEHITRTS